MKLNLVLLFLILTILLNVGGNCRMAASLSPPHFTSSGVKCFANQGYSEIALVGYDLKQASSYCSQDLFTI